MLYLAFWHLSTYRRQMPRLGLSWQMFTWRKECTHRPYMRWRRFWCFSPTHGMLVPPSLKTSVVKLGYKTNRSYHDTQIHARSGEVLYMAATATQSNDATAAKQLAEATKRFCRSVELCDDYLRGYYGLRLVRLAKPGPRFVFCRPSQS